MKKQGCENELQHQADDHQSYRKAAALFADQPGDEDEYAKAEKRLEGHVWDSAKFKLGQCVTLSLEGVVVMWLLLFAKNQKFPIP
jgi:cytochrome c551/c552